MAAGKIYKDIPRMLYMLQIIEQYNNQMQLGAEDDIKYLVEKTNNILKLNNPKQFVDDFKYCENFVNNFYHSFDNEWFNALKKAEELKKRQELERGW